MEPDTILFAYHAISPLRPAARRMCLPRQWVEERARRKRAAVPGGVWLQARQRAGKEYGEQNNRCRPPLRPRWGPMANRPGLWPGRSAGLCPHPSPASPGTTPGEVEPLCSPRVPRFVSRSDPAARVVPRRIFAAGVGGVDVQAIAGSGARIAGRSEAVASLVHCPCAGRQINRKPHPARPSSRHCPSSQCVPPLPSRLRGDSSGPGIEQVRSHLQLHNFPARGRLINRLHHGKAPQVVLTAGFELRPRQHAAHKMAL